MVFQRFMTLSRSKLGIITLVVLLSAVFIPRLFSERTYQLSDLKTSNPSSHNLISNTSQNNQLEQIVMKSLTGKNGQYAVYIESLNKQEQVKTPNSGSVLGQVFKDKSLKPQGFELNTTNSFPSASLYKLVLMAAVYKQIQDGRLSLEDNMTASKQYLTERLGSVDFGYEEVGDEISYTTEEALTRTATISDNFAAIMLTDKIFKLSQQSQNSDLLTQTARDLGMNNTFFKKDELITTTAQDVAIFFKHLYKGEVVSPEYSAKIIEMLSQSKLNNRIPDQLPDNIKIAHKTGELSRVRHDAGIVFLPDNPYLIVLLSQDLEDENEGVQTFSDLSKKIFDFFEESITPTPVEK